MNFPNELETETVDLIDRLLHVDPLSRLGAGQKGGDNDYTALKSHPFFNGINFKTLSEVAPPVP